MPSAEILLGAKALITAVELYQEYQANHPDMTPEEIAEKVLRSEALATAANRKFDETE